MLTDQCFVGYRVQRFRLWRVVVNCRAICIIFISSLFVSLLLLFSSITYSLFGNIQLRIAPKLQLNAKIIFFSPLPASISCLWREKKQCFSTRNVKNVNVETAGRKTKNTENETEICYKKQNTNRNCFLFSPKSIYWFSCRFPFVLCALNLILIQFISLSLRERCHSCCFFQKPPNIHKTERENERSRVREKREWERKMQTADKSGYQSTNKLTNNDSKVEI